MTAEELLVRYGPRLVLDGLSFTASPGEVLAVLGANGSGKSTLLRTLAGLLPHGGRIARPPGAPGYMPQDNAAQARLTAFELVLLGRLRHLGLQVATADLAAAEAAMAEIGIAHLAGQRIATLSGGQRQMVFLAQVLAAGPAMLLLDEPTSALDIAHQLHVLGLIRAATRRRGLVTIAVLHDLNAAARFADRLMLLHQGRLLGIGTPAEILTPALLRQVFGVEAAVLTGPDGAPVVIPLRAAGSEQHVGRTDEVRVGVAAYGLDA